MQRNKVLDSSALIAYLGAEKGCDRVMQIFQKAAKNDLNIFMSVIHWGEVLSVIERRYNLQKKDEVKELMERMTMEIVPVDKEQARTASHIRTKYKLHYIDAFAASLAVTKKAELWTADKDFEAVKHLISVIFL